MLAAPDDPPVKKLVDGERDICSRFVEELTAALSKIAGGAGVQLVEHDGVYIWGLVYGGLPFSISSNATP